MLLERLDLTQRAEPHDLPEWMDEPCSYEEFRACLVDLAQVNRLTLAARPTLDFLERLWRSHPTLRDKAAKDGPPSSEAPGNPTHDDKTVMNGPPGIPLRPPGPLRIVDVGCGGGDMLRRVARWARRRGIAVQLTGIDLNPYAARAAQEFTADGAAITWMTGDAFCYTEPIDIVLSSLFTHHLSEAEIVRFLAWMEARARLGWFINDLVREEMPLRLFSVMAAAAGWHRFVRHDGPVSFRRSFREADWERMAAAAGVPLDALTLRRWTPGRLCVGRLR